MRTLARLGCVLLLLGCLAPEGAAQADVSDASLFYLPLVAKQYAPGMVYVPAGTFQMGCDPAHNAGYTTCTSSSNEYPLHTLNLSGYFIDIYEVTNIQYARCVSAGICPPPANTSSATRPTYYLDEAYQHYPVIYVTWTGAQAYCAWLGKRLPSEAEWEKAARGPADTRPFVWGDGLPDCSLANVNNCLHDTSAVGSFPTDASPYGVLDMTGNVAEWVNDWFSGSYYGVSPADDPTGPATGTSRGIRGGSWGSGLYFTRLTYRYFGTPDNWGNFFGFRCALSGP